MVFVKFLEKNCRKGQFSPSKMRGKWAIELGAGCGLAGFGMALLGCDVAVTDQTEVLLLLMRNVERKAMRIKQANSENPYSEFSSGNSQETQGLKRSEETIRKCSRLQFLLERKKAIMHSGDSEESHNQKIDKMRLLEESLAVSTTKAKKQIADNRHQKEEVLNYHVGKANEVTEVEKELSAEFEMLDKRRVELEEELKKVNVALGAVNKRRINAQEEKEQFFEASSQIVSHLKMKEDELMRSVAGRKTESFVVNTWTNFLEDTWILQSSQSQQKEQAMKDALEEANRHFLQFVISKLPAFKEYLDIFLDQITTFSKAINDMSNKRSQFDKANESEVSERRKVEEKYLEAESQAITIFGTVDSIKTEFHAHERSKA